MSVPRSIFVGGAGAVSPAGWGIKVLDNALTAGISPPSQLFSVPGKTKLCAKRVPMPTPRPSQLQHPRLRRSSAVSQFAVSAALEALGDDADRVARGELRLGIIFTVMTGGVIYSRRFYSETMENPSTASPMLFPETVYNAPASHVGAVLGTSALNYTLVSDQTGFVQGLALAADWLCGETIDGCVVVASEEADWLTTAALRPFRPRNIPSEGAGAVYLRRESAAVELRAVTDPQPFVHGRDRAQAWNSVRDQLATLPGDTLWAVTSSRIDPEMSGWPVRRVNPTEILGDSLAAAGAWACVAAVSALATGSTRSGWVAVSGSNFQAIGAAFSVSGR